MARGTIISKTLQDGRKRYITVIRVDAANGKKKQIWKTFEKRKEAESYLDRNSTDIREGSWRELKKASFNQYVPRWQEKHLIPEKLKPSTINGYASALSKHLIPTFGPCQMTAIDADAITTFESKLLRTGKSPKHTRNVLQVLSRIFTDAQREGYVRFSPMTNVKLTPLQHAEGRALTPAEAQALLAECDGILNLIVLLLLLAGLRRNELFALHWPDIDFEKDFIRIRRNLFWRYGKYQERAEDEAVFIFTTPKSKTSKRDVDLSPALKDALWAHYMEMQMAGKTGLIFQTSNGTPYDPGNIYERWFQPAVERARQKALMEAQKEALKDGKPFDPEEFTFLQDVTLHTLRHTFGSWKIAQGEDIVYVSRQMGHANVSITANVYAHLIDKRRPQAAAKTDEFLFGKAAVAAD